LVVECDVHQSPDSDGLSAERKAAAVLLDSPGTSPGRWWSANYLSATVDSSPAGRHRNVDGGKIAAYAHLLGFDACFVVSMPA
jgi:hypothetical protein